MLTLIAVLLTIVLSEEAYMALAIVARTTGTIPVLRTATAALLLDVYFICKLESEGRSQKSEIGGRMSDDRRQKKYTLDLTRSFR